MVADATCIAGSDEGAAGLLSAESGVRDQQERVLEDFFPNAGDTFRKAAVDLLEVARCVCCMGQGGSMLIAAEAAHLFSSVSEKFFAVSDSHLQMMRAATMGRAGSPASTPRRRRKTTPRCSRSGREGGPCASRP